MAQEQFINTRLSIPPKEILELFNIDSIDKVEASIVDYTLTLRPTNTLPKKKRIAGLNRGKISMSEDFDAPLMIGDDGTIRVKGSRVTLDVIVRQFKQGATAEQILEDFPSLNLRDVYGAIYYYLDHEEEVDEYLKKQKDAADETRKFIESKMDGNALRERIRARHKQLVNK